MPRREHLLEHGLLLGALAVLAGGYERLLSGSWWWITIVAALACVLGATALVRHVGARGAPLAGLVTGFVVVALASVPSTLLLGVIPTPTTFTAMAELLDRARTLVAEEVPPVEAIPPITLVAAGAFALVALVADLLLQRRGGVPLIGLLLVVTYLVPAVVADEVPSFVVLVVPAGLWLVLLHRSALRARPGGLMTPAGLLVGSAAVVLAFVLVPVLPDTSAVTGRADDLDAGPFGRGINPILSLGDDLRSPSRALALEYTTDGPPPYLSVAMLRDFTGETWRPVTEDDVSYQEGRADLSEEVDVGRQVVEVEIRDLRTTMLPVSYPAVDVRGLEGEWNRLDAGLTFRSDSSDTGGQTYSVTSLVRRPTPQQLVAPPPTGLRLQEDYLELPDDLPQSITDAAQLVTGGAVGAYAKAQALQDFFRSGAFEYSETAPVDGDYDGNGIAVIERFLQERSGYCVHFSSAMAVMARSVGVPARIMVGYAPGTRAQPRPGADPDEERYRVTTDQLHAWPQIYVDGVGWVEFEPTPGIVDDPDADEDDDTSSAPVPTTSVPVPEPTQAVPTPTPQTDPSSVAAAPVERSTDVGRTVLLLVAILGALAVAPALARAALRRRRLRRSSTPDDWWREIVATADDVGIASDPSTTLSAHVDELSQHVETQARDALERLRTLLEAQRYGPRRVAVGTAAASRADAVSVVEHLLARATPADRRRARVLPRSLLRRS